MPSANMDRRSKRDPKSDQSTPESLDEYYLEIVGASFKEYGLTYGNFSKIAENTANVYEMVTECSPKNTSSACFDRLVQGFADQSSAAPATFTPPSVTNDAWNEDIRQLALFGKSFAESVEMLSKELALLANKPRQPQK